MKSGLVRYACRAKIHVDGSQNAGGAAGNPVTIYEGAWAYCPAGAMTEHVWEAIKPVSLTDLKLVELIVRPRDAAAEGSRTRA